MDFESEVLVQGLVTVLGAASKAALVEINCETDFVARNESFQGLLPIVARAALDLPVQSSAELLSTDDVSSQTVEGKSVRCSQTAPMLPISIRRTTRTHVNVQLVPLRMNP